MRPQEGDAEEVTLQSAGGVEDDWATLLDSHVRQYGRFYHRLAYGVLQSTEAAADVCQQAFLRAWQHRDRIREPRAMRSWLARVVMNESFYVLRRRRTERQVLEDRAHSATDNTHGAVESTDRRDLVLSALARLPEPIREVVTLRTMQEMSGNEVSELLGSSAADVSRRLHEGLDRLRRLLTDRRGT